MKGERKAKPKILLIDPLKEKKVFYFGSRKLSDILLLRPLLK